jgi:hypothetical protein
MRVKRANDVAARADDILIGYLTRLGLARAAIRSNFAGVYRSSPVEPLMAHCEDGSRRRYGQLDGIGSFELHGFGCRVEFDSGEAIDFDWNDDGDEIFEEWRLKYYAESIGASDVSCTALIAACGRLVDAGILEEDEEGWFRISRGRPNNLGPN